MDIGTKHRTKRIVMAVTLGGGLALGIAGLAQAADVPAPSGSAQPSGPAGQPGEAGRPAGPREGRTHQPHLDGTVTSITDTKIQITDRDGFTRQINIKTKPAGIAVGTRVHAEGTVNADKVSLDATSVVVAPEPDGKRGGGPGHRPGGPGGRGGPEVPGTPPSGAPSAPPVPPSDAPSAPATPPSGAPSAPVTPPSVAPSAS